jgi:peptidoglycan/LPS O-acetylase OafA/YrhL
MKQISSIGRDFRNDINGVRAWAVVAVILYHFGIPGLAGGFVGVDVFFVISGYLMAGIVVVALERERFSIIAFYISRARRILPALLALCASLLALGWWTLLPLDYMSLGSQVMFSVFFLSNIKFWREAGYFDPASHEKLLLHTWSLAVEWQFYLLLPIILFAVWKWRHGRRPAAIVLAAGFIISFALSAGVGGMNPSTAFYLLPARSWEMLAGCLVFLSCERLRLTARQSTALELSGFALVIASIIIFDGSTPWPSWRALIPVIGTIAIIIAARPHSPLTGNVVAQWLGTRSYSLYLWHWPVVVALSYLGVKAEVEAIAAGLALTLLLGNLSYHLIEERTRLRLAAFATRRNAAILSCASIAVAVLGVGIKLQKGVGNRFPSDVELIASESKNQKPDRDRCLTTTGRESNSCAYGGARLRAVLLGDSHADAVTTALAAAIPNTKDGIVEWSYTACPTILGVKKLATYTEGETCGGFLEWATTRLAQFPKNVPVVVVNRTSAYALGYNEALVPGEHKPLVYFTRPYTSSTPDFLTEFSRHLTETACTLSKDRQVYLMRPIPEMGVDVPTAMSRAALRGKHEDISISLAEYHKRHSVVWAAQDLAQQRCGVKILNPLPYLCPDGRCHGAKDGRPIYFDDDHLSEYGNKLLVPMFAKVFEQG